MRERIVDDIIEHMAVASNRNIHGKALKTDFTGHSNSLNTKVVKLKPEPEYFEYVDPSNLDNSDPASSPFRGGFELLIATGKSVPEFSELFVTIESIRNIVINFRCNKKAGLQLGERLKELVNKLQPLMKLSSERKGAASTRFVKRLSWVLSDAEGFLTAFCASGWLGMLLEVSLSLFSFLLLCPVPLDVVAIFFFFFFY